jgi:hypothetical protein
MNIRHSTPNIQGGRRRSPKSRRSPLCHRAGRSLRSRVQGPKSKGPQTARDGGAPGVSTLAMRRPSLDCRHGGRRSGAFPGGDQVVFAKRSHLFAEFGCFPQTAAASCRVSADELMQVVDFPHPRGVRLVSGRSGVFPSIGGGFGLQRVKSSAWARLGSLKTAWARLAGGCRETILARKWGYRDANDPKRRVRLRSCLRPTLAKQAEAMARLGVRNPNLRRAGIAVEAWPKADRRRTKNRLWGMFFILWGKAAGAHSRGGILEWWS